MCTNRALHTADERINLRQHGVGAVLEGLLPLLRILGAHERVQLLSECLLELGRVLLDFLQRRRRRLTLHHRSVALKPHTQTRQSPHKG